MRNGLRPELESCHGSKQREVVLQMNLGRRGVIRESRQLQVSPPDERRAASTIAARPPTAIDEAPDLLLARRRLQIQGDRALPRR
eukprot:6200233-Pleurochrysis_carterae.AAC.2